MKILEMKTTRTQLCSRSFLFPRSPSSLAYRLFIVLNLDSFQEIFFRGARIRRQMTLDTHENKKKIQMQIKIQRWSALLRIFFREYEKFVKDTGIYKGRKAWKTGIQQKKGGICVVLIWRRPRIGPPYFSSRFMDHITQVSSSSLFPAKDSLKINRSVKMPGHRSSMRVEGSK